MMISVMKQQVNYIADMLANSLETKWVKLAQNRHFSRDLLQFQRHKNKHFNRKITHFYCKHSIHKNAWIGPNRTGACRAQRDLQQLQLCLFSMNTGRLNAHGGRRAAADVLLFGPRLRA
jgi:hypothetical protein